MRHFRISPRRCLPSIHPGAPLPPRGHVTRGSFPNNFLVQSFVLQQEPAHIEEADVVVFERRAARVIPKMDVRARVDGVGHPQTPRLVAAIEIGDVDPVQYPIVAEQADPFTQRRGPQNGNDQIRAGMHAPFGQGCAESRGRFGQMKFRGEIEQTADADGAVDDEPTEAAYSPPQSPLHRVIDEVVDFRQVSEEIVHAGANRRWQPAIGVRNGQEHRFVKSCVESIVEAVEAFPGIVRSHRRRIRRRQRRRLFLTARLFAFDFLLVFRQGFGSCDCRGVIGRRRFRRQSMNDEVLRRAAAEAQSKCEDHVEDSH